MSGMTRVNRHEVCVPKAWMTRKPCHDFEACEVQTMGRTVRAAFANCDDAAVIFLFAYTLGSFTHSCFQMKKIYVCFFCK